MSARLSIWLEAEEQELSHVCVLVNVRLYTSLRVIDINSELHAGNVEDISCVSRLGRNGER